MARLCGTNTLRGCGSKVSTPAGWPALRAREVTRLDQHGVAAMQAVEIAHCQDRAARVIRSGGRDVG